MAEVVAIRDALRRGPLLVKDRVRPGILGLFLFWTASSLLLATLYSEPRVALLLILALQAKFGVPLCHSIPLLAEVEVLWLPKV